MLTTYIGVDIDSYNLAAVALNGQTGVKCKLVTVPNAMRKHSIPKRLEYLISESRAFFRQQKGAKVLIEFPEVQGVHTIKALVPLASSSIGLWQSLQSIPFESIELVTPFGWKGQLPKSVIERRLKNQSAVDLIKAEFGSRAHHLIDALALALCCKTRLAFHGKPLQIV